MKTPHLSRSIAIGAAIPLMISFMGVSAVAAEPTAADSASESSAAAEAASPDAASKPSSAGTTLVAGAAEMAPAISSATSTAIQVGIEGVPAAAPAVTAEVDYTKVHHDEGPQCLLVADRLCRFPVHQLAAELHLHGVDRQLRHQGESSC